MTMPPFSSPPPGWYPDPAGGPGLRYWDGVDWVTAPPAGSPPSLPVMPPAKQGMSTGGKIALAGAGLFLVVAWGIGSAVDSGNKETTGSSSTTFRSDSAAERMPAAPSTPQVAPAGSAVRDGKFEFRVLNVGTAKTVGDPGGNPYMQETAQGMFVVVTLNVTNIGAESQSFFASNQKLIDAQGREYEASSAADMYMNDDALGTGINPGNSIQVKVAFDVQPGIVAAALELHDSMLSGGALLALPGRVG